MASYAELVDKPLASSQLLKNAFYAFASFGNVEPASTQFFTVTGRTSTNEGSGSSSSVYRGVLHMDDQAPLMYFYHFNKMLTEAGLYQPQYNYRTESPDRNPFTDSAARAIFLKAKKSSSARLSYHEFVHSALDAIADLMSYQTAQSVADRIIVARQPLSFESLVRPHRLSTGGAGGQTDIDALPEADAQLERDILLLEAQALEADMKIAVSHEEQQLGHTLETVLSEARDETRRVFDEAAELEREIAGLAHPGNFGQETMERYDLAVDQLEGTFAQDHPRELWEYVQAGNEDNHFVDQVGVSSQYFNSIDDITKQQAVQHQRGTADVYVSPQEFDARLEELWNRHAAFLRRNEDQAAAIEREKAACNETQGQVIAEFQREHLNERRKLDKLRKNLKMILTEMSYHKKRGTYIKAHDNVGKNGTSLKNQELRLERVKDIYFKQRQAIVKQEEIVKELSATVQGLKRRQNTDNRQIEATEREIVEEMERTAAEQEEAHWELESLKREFEEIRKIRSEVMGMHAVMKHKLDDEIVRQPDFITNSGVGAGAGLEWGGGSTQEYVGGDSPSRYNAYHPVHQGEDDDGHAAVASSGQQTYPAAADDAADDGEHMQY